MTNEDGERARAHGRTSSVPARPARSEPPTPSALPSVPPSTDEIDTDWGAEPQATPAAAPAPSSAAPPPVVAGAPGARPNPLRKQTLLGISPPGVTPSSVPPAATALSTPLASVTPRPAFLVPANAAPSVRPNPLRSRTLIGIAAPIAPAASVATETPASAAAPVVTAPVVTAPVVTAPVVTAPVVTAPLVTAPVEAASATGSGRAESAPAAAAAVTRPPVARTTVNETPRSRAKASAATAPSSTAGSARSAHSPAPESAPKSSAGAILLLVVAAVAGVVGYRFLRHDDRVPAAIVAATPVAAPVLIAPAGADGAAQHAPAPTARPVDSLAAPAPSASVAPSASAAMPTSVRTVTINTVPPKAKFFHLGKEVGTAPFVVEVPKGEKRAYEVWLPGHITRKVLIDGSKPELTLGLREDTAH